MEDKTGIAGISSLYIFFSVLPDIDFTLGFIVHDPNLFHQGLTHTLGAAVIAGTIGIMIELMIFLPPIILLYYFSFHKS
ncbi:MAG: hypothetical protein KAJ93_07850 [Methanosarcinales archaeon]|nr:hypothetical protein [Methanosarcinales archaeon]